MIEACRNRFPNATVVRIRFGDNIFPALLLPGPAAAVSASFPASVIAEKMNLAERQVS